MDEQPPRRQDPIAIAVLGTAALLAVGLILYVFLGIAPAPPSTPQKPGLVEQWRSKLKAEPERPKQKPQSKPAAVAATPQTAARFMPEAGRTWRYAVSVEPAVWRDATLTYRTQREGDALVVLTDFRHAGGQMAFRLGSFARGHPSHANVRFPGFFMHASYLDLPLEAGQRVSWEWPWQLPGGAVRSGRLKRYQGRVLRWENVQVPAGSFSAALIDVELTYVDEGRVQAKAKETLWYAPKALQVVKIVREGRVPDESVGRIVAELAEYR